ncbi:MAG TPA: hypothetical protein VJ809_17375 [Pirellulales bacterium]|nr:hypothetical protein [Pirellulales bacterium]
MMVVAFTLALSAALLSAAQFWIQAAELRERRRVRAFIERRDAELKRRMWPDSGPTL